MDPREAAEVIGVLAADPLVGCPVAELVTGYGIAGGPDGRLITSGGPSRSLFYVAGGVLPLRARDDDMRAFAGYAGAERLGPRSVHGRREHVARLWEQLEPLWGRPREYRDDQQLMALVGTGPAVAPDPAVRLATGADHDAVLAAAASVYREELGSDPLALHGGVPFRRRVARSIARGRTWVLEEDGRVVFKADVASRSVRAAQLQGVWVAPDRRGRGVGARGLATVCARLQQRGVTPGLVVNGHNEPALRCYRTLGMRRVLDYATVLVH